MARTKVAKPGSAAPLKAAAPGARANRMEFAVFAVLLALIPIRTFVSEAHDFGVASWFRNVSTQSTAHAGHTFVFIAAICACAALAASTRRVREAGWQSTGLLAGGVLLAIAATISTLQAGQKHLAIAGSLDFLALLLYAATLRQMLARPWHVRLAVAVILATGAAVIIKCGIQKWIELPATIRLFEDQYRAALTYGQEDPGRLYDFEQRMRSGAVTGYFSHANVLAGYLILVAMAGVGVASARWKSASNGQRAPSAGERVFRRAAIAPAIIALFAFVTLVFTQSKGGVAAGGAALALWGIGAAARNSARLRALAAPSRIAAVVWMGLLALGVVVFALLRHNPETLGRSIYFRWLYWEGAAGMLSHEGLWGVGAGNFGRFFSRYKPPICPEDVQDPHSWIVRSLCEWGSLGLLALLAAWIGWTIVTARRWRTPDAGALAGPMSTDAPAFSRQQDIGAWAIALTLLTTVVWSIITAGAAAGLWEQTVLIAVACWLAAFLMVSIERRRERQYFDTDLPVDAWALVAGLVAFLVHSAIDLELFWAGPATLFFALAAIVQAATASATTTATLIDKSRRASPVRAAAVAIAFVATIVIFAFLAVPALRLGKNLNDARIGERPRSWSDYSASSAHASYLAAIDAYRFDATAIDELSSDLTGRIETPENCDRVLLLLDAWRTRDPRNSAIDQRASTVLAAKFHLKGDPRDLDAAIGHMERAVAAGPAAPQRWVALGQLHELRSQSEPAARERAIAAYEKALDLDERRTLVSQPNRMTDAMRAKLRERIDAMRQRSARPEP